MKWSGRVCGWTMAAATCMVGCGSGSSSSGGSSGESSSSSSSSSSTSSSGVPGTYQLAVGGGDGVRTYNVTAPQQTGVGHFPDTGATNPSWSPDGASISYLHLDPGAYYSSDPVVAIVSTSTGVITQVPRVNGRVPYDLEWAPTGQQIAVAEYAADAYYYHFYLGTYAASSGERQSVETTGYPWLPKWDPTGSQLLAFQQLDFGGSNYSGGSLKLLDVGSNPPTQASLAADVAAFAWAPSGSKLAYALVSGGYYSNGLCSLMEGSVTNHALSGTTLVADQIACPSDMEWSPAGGALAYAALDGYPAYDGLFVLDMNAARPQDGRSMAPLVRTVLKGDRPFKWSPDGRYLAYASARGSNSYDAYTNFTLLERGTPNAYYSTTVLGTENGFSFRR